LFNRLTRTRNAIVDDRPGVTRDRLYGIVYYDDHHETGFTLIDTGGFETEGVYYQPFSENLVWTQTELAIKEADVVVLLLDGKGGVHQHDHELARYLERLGKQVIYVANKIDGPEHRSAAFEFYELGVTDVLTVSAAHGRQIDLLLETIQERISLVAPKADSRLSAGAPRIALIGRPNAGKSSILNRLAGEERSVVSEVAGTTRDAIDTPITFNKKNYVIVDTAGIRRRSKIHDKVEGLSVMRSLQSIERADIVMLVIDAKENLTDQDARLADLAASQYKPVAIIVNKWDLVPNKDSNSARDYERDLKVKLKLLQHVPVLFVSCLENQRVHQIMNIVEGLAEDYDRRVSTRDLNDALRTIVYEHTPALIRKYSKRPKFYFATQVRTRPPTIVIFCNVANEIQESYKRYIIKRFREMLGYGNGPLRVLYRSKAEVRASKEQQRENSRRGFSTTPQVADDGFDYGDLPEMSEEDAFSPPESNN
jgi:GTP-binding protein